MLRKNRFKLFTGIIVLFGMVSLVIADTVTRQVLSAGGAKVSDATYTLQGTLVQTIIGKKSDATYSLYSGYWGRGEPPTGCCVGIRGDIDGDGDSSPDFSDLTYYIAYLNTGGPAPPCFEEADLDEDDDNDNDDMVYLRNYLLMDGPAPPSCP